MNIAFIHPDLGIGGAERLVVDAARAMHGRGHRVAIFTAQHDAARSFEETRAGRLDVRVHGSWLPVQIAGRLRAPCAIARMSTLALTVPRARERFDVIVCDLVPHVVPLLRRLTATPVVLYCHFPDLLLAAHDRVWLRAYRAPLDRWEAWATGRADRVLVNSAFTAAALRRAFPRLRNEAVVLHPGVASAGPASPPSASHTILAIGRFAPEKNLILALEAYIALRNRLAADAFRATRLVIAGGYDDRLRECRETVVGLETRAQQAGLAAQVEIRRSPGEAQRTALLAHCRCVVHTPVEEHFGYVPVEAMANGRPVVASDRGGPAETVVDGETGFLRAAHPDAFAGALQCLLAEPETADRMGAAGRHRVEQCFSLDAFGNKLEQILVDVAAPGTKRNTTNHR